MNELNFIQKLIVKNLVSVKVIGQVVKYAAGQAAAWIVAYLVTAPAWLQVSLKHFSEETGIEMNEYTLTIVFGFLISEALQMIANRTQGKGAEKIQEVVGEVRDQWIGNKTVEAVVTLKGDLLEKARQFEAARIRIAELAKEIEELKSQQQNAISTDEVQDS